MREREHGIRVLCVYGNGSPDHSVYVVSVAVAAAAAVTDCRCTRLLHIIILCVVTTTQSTHFSIATHNTNRTNRGRLCVCSNQQMKRERVNSQNTART